MPRIEPVQAENPSGAICVSVPRGDRHNSNEIVSWNPKGHGGYSIGAGEL